MELHKPIPWGMLCLSFFLLPICEWAYASEIRIKELARVDGVRSNKVVGQGLVVGLAGTGDSARNKVTQQSVMNMLNNFGISVSTRDISARNSAIVSITAEIPPFSQLGDLIDITVSSIGDARSLVGGTLLLSPLKAANGMIYALAQGQVSVGGFVFEINGNSVQKNHPSVGTIPNGATIEKQVATTVVSDDHKLRVLLNDPDYTTADRIGVELKRLVGEDRIKVRSAGMIEIDVSEHQDNLVELIARIESIRVKPDRTSKIVINERTGTLVAGGDIRIDHVTISHGNIRVVVSTEFSVSQPSFVRNVGAGVSSVVIPNTSIEVEEGVADSIDFPGGTSIADLVSALRQIKTSTRDVIIILQAIKASGALNAELVIL